MLTIGSLFSGYGGLDMAVESVIDARTVWVSDIDKGACKVLRHRLPGVPNLGDVTAIDWATVPKVDIITGGSPCQDLSTAGRRAGMAEGTRSNLWVSMREAIAYVRPQFVFWENVQGSLSAAADSDVELCTGCMGDGDGEPHMRALGRVLGDLADLGFDAEWRGLRASDVGACHRRFRVFVLAWRRDVADSLGGGRVEVPIAGGFSSVQVARRPGRAGGTRFAPAIARHEHALGRRAPSPAEHGRNGNLRLSAAFDEWMMMLPAGWITDAPGVTRIEALRLAGNGVVPAQAAAALRDMLHAAADEVPRTAVWFPRPA